jgi:hypothetical protein
MGSRCKAFVYAILMALMTVLGLGGPDQRNFAGVLLVLLPPTLSIALAAAPGSSSSSCPDPMAVMKAFYDANDASRFDASLGFFTEDATLSTWAEGVNGYHARARHFTGKQQIRPVLGDPGFRRTPAQLAGPIYHETRIKISGGQLTFMLEPDRLRPNGKPYNPYRVEVVFEGCKIKSLIVIDSVTWL